MKKKSLVLLLAFVLGVMLASTVFADWVKVGENWTYEENGAAVKLTWKLLKRGNDYSSYYFDENGHMVTGVWKIDNEYYSFKNDGIANSKAVVMIDGEKYDTGTKGLIEEYPSEYGQDNFKGSWQTVGTNYKYLVDGVPLVSTWRLIYLNDKLSWFYFDENGFVVTGLKRLPDNNFYYFDKYGAAQGNSDVKLYDYGMVHTEKKGQITTLPNGFDINAYMQESSSAAIEEASIAESRKLQAEQNAIIASEEAIKNEAAEKERKAQEEAQKAVDKAAKEAAKISLLTTEDAVFAIEGDDEKKILIQYKVPVLKGGNASVLNGVINTKLKDLIYVEMESRITGYGGKNIQLGVTVKHDMDNNLVRLKYAGDKAFTILLNTVTLDMWVEY